MSRLPKYILLLSGFLLVFIACWAGWAQPHRRLSEKVPPVCTLYHYTSYLAQERDNKNIPGHHPEKKQKHKASRHRNVEVKFTATFPPQVIFCFDNDSRRTPALPRTYGYLFFSEINPPPPKRC